MELVHKVTHTASNGILDERLKHYDCEHQTSDGHRVADDRGYEEGLSPESGGVADSSSEVKEERSDNHGSSSDRDPPDESLFALRSAQEALQKEILRFQEFNKDGSFDDSVSDIGTDCIIDDAQETSFLVVEKEIEDLFKLKIEAEVEYTIISRTGKKLNGAAADQITILKEQKALATEQTRMLDKLGAAENNAALIMKEAETLEDICEGIVSADEILKMQSSVCKYGSCFLVQLVSLLLIFGFVVFCSSLDYVEVVPT